MQIEQGLFLVHLIKIGIYLKKFHPSVFWFNYCIAIFMAYKLLLDIIIHSSLLNIIEHSVESNWVELGGTDTG